MQLYARMVQGIKYDDEMCAWRVGRVDEDDDNSVLIMSIIKRNLKLFILKFLSLLS